MEETVSSLENEEVEIHGIFLAFELTGLGRGGTQLQKLKRNYNEAIKNLVELATLQTSFVILDDVIKITNRRVNAIEHGSFDHSRSFISFLFFV